MHLLLGTEMYFKVLNGISRLLQTIIASLLIIAGHNFVVSLEENEAVIKRNLVHSFFFWLVWAAFPWPVDTCPSMNRRKFMISEILEYSCEQVECGGKFGRNQTKRERDCRTAC